MVKKTKSAASRPLDPDTMGRMGQTRFGELCDAGGLIANDSARADRMGWDYFVEFRHSSGRKSEPFDKLRKLPDFKVQVKTIWSDRRSVDVNLFAAERLVRWYYPSFIVILRMNMDKTYKDAYVIHLLDDNLARILKALRQAEAENSLSIKNRTISFTIQHGVGIEADGDELVAILRSAVGDDSDAYIKRKCDQFRNLGYELPRYNGRFTLLAKSENDVLDVILGLKEGKVTSIDIDEVRFGISIPQLREASASIQFRPKSQGRCELVITSKHGDRKRAKFDADFYSASTTMTMHSAWKIMICSPIVSLFASHDEGKAELTIGVPSGDRLTLDEWIRIARVQLIVASGPSAAFVRMNGMKIFAFDVDSDSSLTCPEELASKIEFLTEFGVILRGIGLPDVKMNGADIEANLDAIKFVLNSRRIPNDVTVGFKVAPVNVDLPVPDEIEGFFASTIMLSGLTIAFWAIMRVSTTREDGLISFQCRDFSLREIDLLEGTQTFEDYVQEASQSSGLDLVISTRTITKTTRSVPPNTHVTTDDIQGLESMG